MASFIHFHTGWSMEVAMGWYASGQEIIILSREGDQRNADLETVGPLKNQQMLRKSFNPQSFPLEKNGKDPCFLWISQWISQFWHVFPWFSQWISQKSTSPRSASWWLCPRSVSQWSAKFSLRWAGFSPWNIWNPMTNGYFMWGLSMGHPLFMGISMAKIVYKCLEMGDFDGHVWLPEGKNDDQFHWL